MAEASGEGGLSFQPIRDATGRIDIEQSTERLADAFRELANRVFEGVPVRRRLMRRGVERAMQRHIDMARAHWERENDRLGPGGG